MAAAVSLKEKKGKSRLSLTKLRDEFSVQLKR